MKPLLFVRFGPRSYAVGFEANPGWPAMREDSAKSFALVRRAIRRRARHDRDLLVPHTGDPEAFRKALWKRLARVVRAVELVSEFTADELVPERDRRRPGSLRAPHTYVKDGKVYICIPRGDYEFITELRRLNG